MKSTRLHTFLAISKEFCVFFNSRVTDIPLGSAAKRRERCWRRSLCEWENDVNSDEDSAGNSGEEAKLSGNGMVLSWCEQAQRTRGQSSLSVSRMTMPKANIDCSIGIPCDGKNVAWHVSVQNIFNWSSSILCCGMMFGGHYKADLLLETDESGEHLNLVTSSCSEESRYAVGLQSIKYAQIVLTVWLDIHSNPTHFSNIPSRSIQVDKMAILKMEDISTKTFWIFCMRTEELMMHSVAPRVWIDSVVYWIIYFFDLVSCRMAR